MSRRESRLRQARSDLRMRLSQIVRQDDQRVRQALSRRRTGSTVANAFGTSFRTRKCINIECIIGAAQFFASLGEHLPLPVSQSEVAKARSIAARISRRQGKTRRKSCC